MTDLSRTPAEAPAFDAVDLVHIGHDVAVLESFYHAHVEDVLRYLTRRVSDPHDVADRAGGRAAVARARRHRRAGGTHRRGRPGCAGQGPSRSALAEQRELVELVDIEGFTAGEVAKAVGISSGLARIRLHRARIALRTAYFNGEEDHDPVQ